MGENSAISWTHHTFNPWWGCVRVSPGCEHCYAETFAHRLGMDLWGPLSERRLFGDKKWNEPLRWNRRASERGVRERVFCASMADVFEDYGSTEGRKTLDAQRARLWGLIEATPQLDWLLLTKRPWNMLEMTPAHWRGGWPPNAWPGTTAENQDQLEARAAILCKVPADAPRWLSCEPLLGPLNLQPFIGPPSPGLPCAADMSRSTGKIRQAIRWAIFGGESGAHARPCAVEWIREGVAQCRAAGIATFVKQLGAHVIHNGASGPGQHWPRETGSHDTGLGHFRKHLVDRKGADPAEWPEDLRVQEFPR